MPGGNPFECWTQRGENDSYGSLFFACEKSRTFARSEEEETNERHERAKTADFKAGLTSKHDNMIT